jgi:hypothetical protein
MITNLHMHKPFIQYIWIIFKILSFWTRSILLLSC